MMLVTKDGIIGSIGGGNLEKTVMERSTIDEKRSQGKNMIYRMHRVQYLA